MAFRLMRYAIDIMQQHLEAGHEHLPLVIPLFFYHGKSSPYPYDMNWLQGFEAPKVATQLYSQDFPLIDVTVIPNKEIMQHRRIALLEFVFKHINLLHEYDPTTKQLLSLFNDWLHALKTGNSCVIMDQLTTKLQHQEHTLKTITAQLRQRGSLDEVNDMALCMISHGMDSQRVSNLTGLKAEDITQLSR